MSRFAETFLVTIFMVGMLNAGRIGENHQCNIQVPVPFRSSAIVDLEVQLILGNGHNDYIFFYPREVGTWSFESKDITPDTEIQGLRITPLSGEPSKFEASVEIDSVTISCSITSDPLSSRGPIMKFCPKSNPVAIGLDEAIYFYAC